MYNKNLQLNIEENIISWMLWQFVLKNTIANICLSIDINVQVLKFDKNSKLWDSLS